MKRSALTIALAAGVLAAPSNASSQVSYVDFSSVAGLQINGNAFQNGNKLTLTPAAGGQSGSAFSTNTVLLNSTVSFSTVFSFEILARGGLAGGADGLTFTVQTNSNNVGASGGGIGYQGIGNSVAVEFDTYNNGEPGGSNHVGINTNGSMNSIQSTAFGVDFDNAATWFAWVDYDGVADLLEVRWANSSTRPLVSMLSAAGIDLPAILGNPNVYVGFTSGTGAGWGEHNILSWNFQDDYNSGGAPLPTTTPEPASIVLMATGLAIVGIVRRRRSR